MNYPDWFSLKKYDGAKVLDEYGWYTQIGYRLFIDHIWTDIKLHDNSFFSGEYTEVLSMLVAEIRAFGIARSQSEIWAMDKSEEEWPGQSKQTFFDPYPYHVSNRVNSNPIQTISKLDILSIVHPLVGDDSADNESQETIADWVGSDGEIQVSSWMHEQFVPEGRHDMYMAVDLDEPDEVLIDKFQSLLSDVRPNKRKKKTKITPRSFDNWSRWKVLAYWDIQFWTRETGNKVTNTQMLKLLFPEQDVHSDRIRQTVKPTCERAFNSYGLLKEMATISHEIQQNIDFPFPFTPEEVEEITGKKGK